MSNVVYEYTRVEVFKTNVREKEKAAFLIDKIQQEFGNCRVTIDLEDCDKVLVVRSHNDAITSKGIIDFLKQLGFKAEALPDQ